MMQSLLFYASLLRQQSVYKYLYLVFLIGVGGSLGFTPRKIILTLLVEVKVKVTGTKSVLVWSDFD